MVKFNKSCKCKWKQWYENDNFQQTFDFHNSNKFENIIEEDSRKILVQNILNPKQIIDNDSKTSTIALRKGLWPLGLFYDLYSKKYNFPTLFYDNSTPSFTCSYQKIIHVELTSVNNNKIEYHITNIFQKIKYILYCLLHGFV